jgi:hypothetical protein
VSTTVKDLSGTLVNAGTLSLTVRKPDATTGTYASPANDSTGVYHQDIPAVDLTQLGRYQYAWTATGTGAGVSPPSGFDVYDPFEITLLSLADAKDVLAKSQTSTTDDAEIMRTVAAIEASLERVTGGPVINRQIAERVDLTGAQTALVLRKRPVVSVQSIVSVASGAAISIADIEIDTNAGIIRRKLGLPFYGPFYTWLPTMTVTYTAGLGVAVPPAIEQAAGIILQHLWESQRGMSSVPRYGGEEELTTIPGLGYMIPNRAAEMLAPWTLEAFV